MSVPVILHFGTRAAQFWTRKKGFPVQKEFTYYQPPLHYLWKRHSRDSLRWDEPEERDLVIIRFRSHQHCRRHRSVGDLCSSKEKEVCPTRVPEPTSQHWKSHFCQRVLLLVVVVRARKGYRHLLEHVPGLGDGIPNRKEKSASSSALRATVSCVTYPVAFVKFDSGDAQAEGMQIWIIVNSLRTWDYNPIWVFG